MGFIILDARGMENAVTPQADAPVEAARARPHFAVEIGVVAPGKMDFEHRRHFRPTDHLEIGKIGQASCRERVCQYVKLSVAAASLNKNSKYQLEMLAT